MSEQLLQQILDKLNQVDHRIAKLEDRVARIEDRIAKLEDRVTRIEDRITNLETGQKELNFMVTAIRHRQDETDAKLESLATNVFNLTQEFASFREETNQRFDNLEKEVSHRFRRLEIRSENDHVRITAVEEELQILQEQKR